MSETFSRNTSFVKQPVLTAPKQPKIFGLSVRIEHALSKPLYSFCDSHEILKDCLFEAFILALTNNEPLNQESLVTEAKRRTQERARIKDYKTALAFQKKLPPSSF